jgi:gas vesicle protein
VIVLIWEQSRIYIRFSQEVVMSNSRFTEGLFFGAIIGAVVALIFAPQSGDKTRKYLKKLKEDNQDLIDETADTAEVAISKTLSAIHTGMDKIQEKFKKELGEHYLMLVKNIIESKINI